MAFDVQAARSAGYSDGEIASYLASQSNFDLAAAQKSGYTPGEIVEFLNQSAAPAQSQATNSASAESIQAPQDLTRPAGALRRDITAPQPTASTAMRAGREEVPGMTPASVAQDIASGALQIGPTAVKGVADLARLATGDRVGKGASEYIEGGMQAIRDTVGSERAAAQRRNFARDMADPDVGLGEALSQNKGALADQILPTVGSMILPVGAAGVAGKAATSGRAAQLAGAIDAGTLAARANRAREGAVIGTTVAQNAASTYGDIRDKGGDQGSAYTGAAITAPFTAVAGKLTGGAAEAQAARILSGTAAREFAEQGVSAIPRAALREGAQEIGEEAGQYIGESVGTGETMDANTAAKRLGVAGTLGAVVGGGVSGVGVASEINRARQAQAMQSIGAATNVDEAIAAAAEAVATPVATDAPAATATPSSGVDQAINQAVAASTPPGESASTQQLIDRIRELEAGQQPEVAQSTEGGIDAARNESLAGNPIVAQGAPSEQAGGQADAVVPEQRQGDVSAQRVEPLPEGAPATGATSNAQPALTGVDPATLLAVAQNPNSPIADLAAAELRRRETEYAYQQRDAQQASERAQQERAILDEAADQQIAQTSAVQEASTTDAPTAMQEAFANARPMRTRTASQPAPQSSIPRQASATAAQASSALPSFTSKLEPAGTLRITGNTNQIRQQLADFGVDKFIPARGGVVVAKSQASRAQQALNSAAPQFSAAANSAVTENANANIDTAPDTRLPDTVAARAESRYQSPTENHATVANTFLERVRRLVPDVSFRAVEPEQGVAGQEMQAARLAARRLFRRDVVFVEFDGKPVFNGAVSDSAPNTVFIRADSAKPHMAVLGHELLHEMRKDNPRLYDTLSSALNGIITKDSEYASDLSSRYEALGMRLPTEWREELHADIVGDHFTDPQFWQDLAAEQPGLFQRVAQSIRQFLNRILAKAKPFGTDRFISDVEAARDAVTTAMREFSRDQVDNIGSSVDGVAASDRAVSAPLSSVTTTPDFRRWFGESKVVDDEGNPLVMYHGTSASENGEAFKSFDTYASNYGLMGQGGYFTENQEVASSYTKKGRGTTPTVYPVYLSIKNPLDMDAAADPGLWLQKFDGVEDFHEGGTTNESWYRAAEDMLRDQRLPMWEGAEAMQDGLRSMGFDGITHIGGGRVAADGVKHRVFIAFDPEQIKSAIGNNGGFDPSNPDIRFSAADMSSPEGWQLPELTRTDKVIFEAQDGRIDLKRTQEAIRAAGREIEERFDARTAETLYAGRVAYRADQFLNAEVKPLLQAMTLSKTSMPELADYLHARGAEERNAQIAKVNPEMPDGGAGTNSKGVLMTNAAAQEYLASVPKERKAVLDSLAKRVDAITKGTRELLVDEGLEKREVVDAWEKAYKNYVPMFRDEAESGSPAGSGGGGFNVRGANSQRATGSTKQVTNILAHVLMQREAAITRAEKNRVGMALYGLALTNPNKDVWTTIRPGMQAEQIAADLKAMGVDPTVAEAGMSGVPTVRGIDPVTNTVVDRANPMYKNLPGAIILKVGGEDRVLMLNEKNERALRMAQSLKNLDGLTNFDLAGSIVGKTTRWLAAVNTQYNPAFGLVNGIRDTFGGAINLTSTPLKGKSAQVLMNAYTKAGPGIAKAIAGGTEGEWTKLYKQFQEDGGQTGYRESFRTAEDRTKAIEKELADLSSQGKLTPRKAAVAVLDLLDGVNTTIENAVRLSAYKAALDQGMSRPASAKLARELTVDFNRKGRLGRELGPLYAFFNASVQGTARTLEALKGPTGAKIIAGGLAIGAAQAIMLAMAGYEEDEIAEFIKARAFIIPAFWSKEKRYIAIPLPLGLHVLPNTGRVITDLALSGGKDAGKKTFEAVGEVAGAFNPLGGGNIFTADGALRTVAPTVIDPAIEIGFNKNFAGSPIEKEQRGESDVRPGFARVKESTQRSVTGQAYIGISKALNTMSGGSDYEAGLASPSPEVVQYTAQVLGGGVLRELEKTINISGAKARGDKVPQSKIPIIGRLYGEVDADVVDRARYFEGSKQIMKAKAAEKAAAKAGDADAVMKLYEKRPELKAAYAQQQISRSISELNKLAISTVNDPEQLRALDEARLLQMRALNQTIKAIEESEGKDTPRKKLRRLVRQEGADVAAP